MSLSDHTKPHYEISDTKNIHLLNERQSATFNVEELTKFMFSGPENYFEINKRRQLIRQTIEHPIHRTHLQLEYLTTDENYSLTIRKSLLAIQEAERLHITNTKHHGWLYDIFTNDQFAFFVHTIMCLYALENLASDEQKRHFLPLLQSYRIIATYAQTELGHGTDLTREHI